MKKKLWIITLFLGVLFLLCACDSEANEANVIPVASEETEAKAMIWERSASDIVTSIKEALSEQTEYDGEYSVIERLSNEETVYVFTYNGIETKNVFTISENTETKTNQITFISMDHNNHVFEAGSDSIVMVCDRTGRYSSFDKAYKVVYDIMEATFMANLDENEIRSASKVIDGVEYSIHIIGDLVDGLWTFSAGKPSD